MKGGSVMNVRSGDRRKHLVLIVLLLCVALACGGAWWVWGRHDDPLTAELARISQDPSESMEYLAPDGQIDSQGHWQAGPASQSRWEQLRTHQWRASSYEALSTAVKAAASLRDNNLERSTQARAAWATGRGIILLASRVTEYSPTAKRDIAVILTHSINEIRNTAGFGSINDSRGNLTDLQITPYDKFKPAPITENVATEITELTRVAGSDDRALKIMIDAVMDHSRINTNAVLDSSPGEVVGSSAELGKLLHVSLSRDGQLIGFIYQSALSARTDYSFRGLQTASPTSDPDFNKIDDSREETKRILLQSAISQIVAYDALPDDSFTDYQGRNYSTIYDWITPEHTIDTEQLQSDPQGAQEWEEWIQGLYFPYDKLITPFDIGFDEGAGVAYR